MIDYWKRWIDGVKPLKNMLKLEEGSVIIGEKICMNVRDKGIKVNQETSLHELVDIICGFEERLKRLIDGWKTVLDEIESFLYREEKQLSNKKEEIENLIKEKKETIQLAKDIHDWIRDNVVDEKGMDALKNFEDFPFEKLDRLARRLKERKGRDPIEVTIKI